MLLATSQDKCGGGGISSQANAKKQAGLKCTSKCGREPVHVAILRSIKMGVSLTTIHNAEKKQNI